MTSSTSTSPVLAAGAVVLRPSPTQAGTHEVLVVHRPGYDDWSLPKGHVDPGESLPVTAVREVREETGWVVRLGARLDTSAYPVNGRPKEVHWWVAVPVADEGPAPDPETDEVRWVATEEAVSLLTFESDRRLVDQAMERGRLVPFIVVRHGKALARAKWSQEDRRRPLTARGHRQSLALIALLTAFGVREVVSSRAVRCIDTLAPYAGLAGLQVRPLAALDEDVAASEPAAATAATGDLAVRAGTASLPTAVCGHRPVLPLMLAALGLEDRLFGPADSVVAYVSADGTSQLAPDHFVFSDDA
ncbi:NUDIX hydrolase [Raineyella fluvialis]|nr:NUDIX hydrolase [Raineyella fluvialis]